jgi:acyl carrier protein
MTRDEAFATFKDAAVDVLSVDADKVVPDASFADDLDALEEKFDVEIPESDLEGVKTVGQAFELVCTKLSI